ncbi:MAG: hypothetical protein RSE41_09490 [Clostridia bacterium]
MYSKNELSEKQRMELGNFFIKNILNRLIELGLNDKISCLNYKNKNKVFDIGRMGMDYFENGLKYLTISNIRVLKISEKIYYEEDKLNIKAEQKFKFSNVEVNSKDANDIKNIISKMNKSIENYSLEEEAYRA